MEFQVFLGDHEAALTQGALKMMYVAKLKLAAALVVAATVVTGGGMAVRQAVADDAPKPEEAAQQPKSERPAQIWGDEKAGLACSISAEKTTFRPGEPILVRFDLKNVSDKPLTVQHCGFWPNHRWIVQNAAGRDLKLTERGRLCRDRYGPDTHRGKNVPFIVGPGRLDASYGPYDLRKLFEIPDGTTVHVRCVYLRIADHPWVEISSNTLTLTVAQADPAKPTVKPGSEVPKVPADDTKPKAEASGSVKPFKYVVDVPAVAEFVAGKHPENCLVVTVRSVATVPGRVGGRRITCKQKVFHDRIEVTPIKVGEPFAGKPEWPEKVAERALVFGIPLLNLAEGETFKILLNFAGQKEELALSYDDKTGLRITPVKTRYFDAGAKPRKSYGRPFRQLSMTDDDTQYCVSNLSLAARRGGKLLWQAPTSKWFRGSPYLPESIELEGEHIVLRTLVPKAGMARRTEPFEVRFSASRGAVVSSTLEKIRLQKEGGSPKKGDPELKRKLEREEEQR